MAIVCARVRTLTIIAVVAAAEEAGSRLVMEAHVRLHRMLQACLLCTSPPFAWWLLRELFLSAASYSCPGPVIELGMWS